MKQAFYTEDKISIKSLLYIRLKGCPFLVTYDLGSRKIFISDQLVNVGASNRPNSLISLSDSFISLSAYETRSDTSLASGHDLWANYNRTLRIPLLLSIPVDFLGPLAAVVVAAAGCFRFLPLCGLGLSASSSAAGVPASASSSSSGLYSSSSSSSSSASSSSSSSYDLKI